METLYHILTNILHIKMSPETTITCNEIRKMKNLSDYEVWDERTQEWVSAETSEYLYVGETGFASTTNPYAPINAVALHHMHQDRSIVIAVPPPGWKPSLFDKSLEELSEIVLVKNEKELLLMLLEEIINSDVLSGWNSDFFDIPYIAKRIEKGLGKSYLRRLSFDNADMPRYREVEVFGNVQIACDISGRVHLDYLNLFKKYEVSERPSYKLEAIAEEVLPHLPKLEYEGSLADLYKKDFNHFLRYNIRDTEILKGFEQKLAYIALANVMCHTSTAQFKDVFGTLKLSDLAVVNFCHYELDVRVPDWSERPDGSIQGAYVLLPQIGMHEWIGSIDINSLYPSSIRSINISPETLIGQFANNIFAWENIAAGTDMMLAFDYEDGTEVLQSAKQWRKTLKENKWAVSGYGTVFDQNKPGIVPTILATWYKQRKEYQKLKNVNYEEAQQYKETDKKKYEELKEKSAYYDRLQYVYKIKLNSFYGALTNYYFRFFDLRMGESTTGTGRAILRHQVRKAAEVLDGEYNINPPLDEESFIKAGGTFPSESIIYGDTDSCVGSTLVDINGSVDTIENHFFKIKEEDCVSTLNFPNNVELLLTHGSFDSPCISDEGWDYKPIQMIYRHKTKKRLFEVTTTDGSTVTVTEDHSLIVVDEDGTLCSRTPIELKVGDKVIEQKT